MNPHWGGARRGSPPAPPPYTVSLRPVLCSVPGDLPQECLYLRTQVFPRLDALCRARCARFAPVDVQWDEEASHRPCDPALRRHPLSSQQLKVSLDLITHSSSFLCLLGHRYGPSRPEDSPPLPAPGPGREALSGVERSLCVAAEGGYPWVLAGRNQTCSPTELQVTQAALAGDPRHCFFYFRDYTLQDEEDEEERDSDAGRRRSLLRAFAGEAEHERRRARALKDRIVAGLQPVRFFRTLQDLGGLVLRDWTGLIEQLYGPPLPEQNPTSLGYQDSVDRRHHEGAVHALCHWFVPSSQTTAVLETLDSFTLRLTPNKPGSPAALQPRTSAAELTCNYENSDTESSIFLICGERGCGKSSLAAWWIQEFRKKNPGILVIPHFCGISNSSVDIGSVLRSQAEWAEGLLDRVRPRPLHVVVQAFTAAAALGPCVLVLDGLDQLTETLGLSMQEVKELRWLPGPLPSQCKLVLTATSTDLTCKSLTLRPDVRALPWPGPPDPRHRRRLLLRHLRPPGLEPPEPLLEELLGGRLGRLPLYLALMAGELQACGVPRAEGEESMEGYAEAKTAAELWERVILRWVRDYGDGGEVCEGRADQTRPLSTVSETELRGWVWDALCLVHLSRSGPTEEQLLALLEALGSQGSVRRVLPLEWARFRAAAAPWVRERAGGSLSLTHQSLHQAMDLLLLRIGPERGPGGLRRRTRRAYQLSMVRFFQRQDRELCSWAVVLEEVPWLLEQCEAWGQLHAFLTDPETVDQLSSRWRQSPQLKMDIVRFWTLLTLRGFDPHTSYQSLLGNEVHGPLPPVALTDTEPSEHRDIDSSTASMTETQSQDNDPVSLSAPGVRGRLGVFVSELLLCLGREGEAERTLLRSQDSLTQAGDGDTESADFLLSVRQTLAELCVAAGRPRRAETHCISALRAADALAASCSQPGGLAVRRGQLLCTLCQLTFADGRAGEASRILRDIISTGHDRVHPCSQATVSVLRGLLRIGRNELAEAEGLLQAALRTRRSWYGGQHPLVVEVEEHLADIWAETSRGTGLQQTQAVALYRHAVCVKDQDVKLCPPTSPLAQTKGLSLTLTLVKLGRLLWQGSSTTERRETIELLQRALDLCIRFLGPEHAHTKDIQRSLTTEFRQLVTSPDPGCRPSSHQKLSASRPDAGTPLYPHTGSDRAAGHAPREPSRERPLSSWSGWSRPAPDLEPVKSRNRSVGRKEQSPRPWSAFQTTVFGPRSDIGDLILAPPRPRPRTAPGSASSRSAEGTRAGQRAGWCHLPGRYLLEEQSVTALNRQIGSPEHRHRHTPMLRQTGQREGTSTAAGTV